MSMSTLRAHLSSALTAGLSLPLTRNTPVWVMPPAMMVPNLEQMSFVMSQAAWLISSHYEWSAGNSVRVEIQRLVTRAPSLTVCLQSLGSLSLVDQKVKVWVMSAPACAYSRAS